MEKARVLCVDGVPLERRVAVTELVSAQVRLHQMVAPMLTRQKPAGEGMEKAGKVHSFRIAKQKAAKAAAAKKAPTKKGPKKPKMTFTCEELGSLIAEHMQICLERPMPQCGYEGHLIADSIFKELHMKIYKDKIKLKPEIPD